MNAMIANLQDLLSMEKDYANYHMDFESWARCRLIEDMIVLLEMTF